MADSENAKLKIAINGFGRIGRMVLRSCLERPDEITVVAVNDPFISPEYMRYQFKFDSTHGTYPGEITYDDNTLIIDGNKITVFQERDPSKIPWETTDAVFVAECTGIFKNVDKAKMHLRPGKIVKVVVSAPNDGQMFVMGVNHTTYEKGTEIISNASCTTNCLAPLAKVMEDSFGIENGLMTTIHAVTATQNSIDGPSKKWRSGRTAFTNIIPATTGAAKAVGKVFPTVNGKLTGMAFRVPVADGSVVDLCVNLKKETTLEEVKAALKKASETPLADGGLKGVLGYTEELVVSNDIIHDSCSSIVDSQACMAMSGKFFKIISWYDNEWGYSNRLVDLALYAAKTDGMNVGRRLMSKL
jgi:glyceraldehyde-3-phosphate dehydrogenase type I